MNRQKLGHHSAPRASADPPPLHSLRSFALELLELGAVHPKSGDADRRRMEYVAEVCRAHARPEGNDSEAEAAAVIAELWAAVRELKALADSLAGP